MLPGEMKKIKKLNFIESKDREKIRDLFAYFDMPREKKLSWYLFKVSFIDMQHNELGILSNRSIFLLQVKVI